MALKNDSTTYSFRPFSKNEPAWFVLRKWCDDNDIGMSTLFNALIQPLKIATQQTAEQHDENHISIEVNIGTIILKQTK